MLSPQRTRSDWVTPLQSLVDVLQPALDAGVLIAAGSDHGGDDTLPAIQSGYCSLPRDARLSVVQVVVAATSVRAMATGTAATDGTLEVGKAATLLILDVTTLDSADLLARPLFVIRRSHIYQGDNLRDPSVPVGSQARMPV